MLINNVCTTVGGRVACGEGRLNEEVDKACASDLLSDVLTLKTGSFALLTGLANAQALRTAEMSDARCLVLCRDKRASAEMIELAEENDIVIIESPYSLFRCAGLLYEAGLRPFY
jgi:predicted transcriptional regulator